MRRVVLTAVIAVLGLAITPSVVAEAEVVAEVDPVWVSSQSGGPTNVTSAVAVNPVTGTVHTTGAGGGTQPRIRTVTYHPDGTVAWARAYRSPDADGVVGAPSVAVEPTDGTVYVLGQASRLTSVLLAYSSAGRLLWARPISTGGDAALRPVGVVVGADGSVYVLLQYTKQTTLYPVVQSYDPAGTVRWQGSLRAAGTDVYSQDIAARPAGGVVVAALDSGSQFQDTVRTTALDGRGAMSWTATATADESLVNARLAVDPDGGGVFVAAGGREAGTFAEASLLLASYTATGTTRFGRDEDSGLPEAVSVDVQFDTVTNRFVVGAVSSGEVAELAPDYAVSAYAVNGGRLWRTALDFPSRIQAGEIALGVSPGSGTVAVSTTCSPYELARCLRTTVLNGDGSVRWTDTVDGIGTTVLAAAALDPATGRYYVVGTTNDFGLTIAYDTAV